MNEALETALTGLGVVIIGIIGTQLSLFLEGMRKKLNESRIVQQLDKDGKLRDALREAFWTGAEQALLQKLPKDAAVQSVIKYVLRSSPETLNQIGMTDSVLRDKAEVALKEAMARNGKTATLP